MNEWEWRLLEESTPMENVLVGDVELKPGVRVRLRPRAGGDILDLALAGQVAIIEAVEQDYEGKIHLAVVLEDDPGRDLGVLRQPGHRFFFSTDEVEPLSQLRNSDCGLRIEKDGKQEAGAGSRNTTSEESSSCLLPLPSASSRSNPQAKGRRILVAGVGNIFLGDDGFGSEVARRLLERRLPDCVRVVDFGIRGFDLAYALLDGYDLTIFVDATSRGQAPGTLYTIKPDLSELDDAGEQEGAMIETHGMNPLKVLRLAKAMGGSVGRILLVGCEPEPLDAEEGRLGLSAAVEAAVMEAVRLVESIVADALKVDAAEAT
jgi:hydrogenase maturation protease